MTDEERRWGNELEKSAYNIHISIKTTRGDYSAWLMQAFLAWERQREGRLATTGSSKLAECGEEPRMAEERCGEISAFAQRERSVFGAAGWVSIERSIRRGER